jgi:hypothetical protein
VLAGLEASGSEDNEKWVTFYRCPQVHNSESEKRQLFEVHPEREKHLESSMDNTRETTDKVSNLRPDASD